MDRVIVEAETLNAVSEYVPDGLSVVYFVKIGKAVKIGVTKRFRNRLAAFLTSVTHVEVLATIEGDRALEKRLHALLTETRILRELFHYDGRIETFIRLAQHDGLDAGLEYLEESTPKLRAQRKLEEQRARVLERRKTRAEMDAYCASLVAERKQRLGW